MIKKNSAISRWEFRNFSSDTLHKFFKYKKPHKISIIFQEVYRESCSKLHVFLQNITQKSNNLWRQLFSPSERERKRTEKAWDCRWNICFKHTRHWPREWEGENLNDRSPCEIVSAFLLSTLRVHTRVLVQSRWLLQRKTRRRNLFFLKIPPQCAQNNLTVEI